MTSPSSCQSLTTSNIPLIHCSSNTLVGLPLHLSWWHPRITLSSLIFPSPCFFIFSSSPPQKLPGSYLCPCQHQSFDHFSDLCFKPPSLDHHLITLSYLLSNYLRAPVNRHCHFNQWVAPSCFAFLFLWNRFLCSHYVHSFDVTLVHLPNTDPQPSCPCTCILSPLSFHCGWGDPTHIQGQLCHSVQFSCPVVSDSIWLHALQHTRLPCPSPTPGVYSNSCQLSRWCHPTTSSSVLPFSSRLQSFPASGSFQMSQFFTSGGQTIGASASASVLPMNIQDWFPLGLTGWISLQSKGLSRVNWPIIFTFGTQWCQG